MWGSGWIASFLLFCAWLLQLFTIIGGLNNQLPFLNEVYFSRVQTGDHADRFYLWNQCSESPLGTVSQCTYPVAGYDWASQTPYNTLPGASGHQKSFFAMSACTWIAFGITTLTLISSLITHCCCRRKMRSRWWDFNHFFWGLIAWLSQLAAFILAVVFGLHGGSLAADNIANTSSTLGPATWVSLGAFAALTLGLLMYCCGFCCPGSKRNRQTVDQTYDEQAQYNQNKESRGWFSRKKQPTEDPETAYNSSGAAYNAGATNTYENPRGTAYHTGAADTYQTPSGTAYNENTTTTPAAYNANNDVRV